MEAEVVERFDAWVGRTDLESSMDTFRAGAGHVAGGTRAVRVGLTVCRWVVLAGCAPHTLSGQGFLPVLTDVLDRVLVNVLLAVIVRLVRPQCLIVIGSGGNSRFRLVEGGRVLHTANSSGTSQ